MWKGINFCGRKRCQKFCTFMLEVTCAIGKIWFVLVVIPDGVSPTLSPCMVWRCVVYGPGANWAGWGARVRGMEQGVQHLSLAPHPPLDAVSLWPLSTSAGGDWSMLKVILLNLLLAFLSSTWTLTGPSWQRLYIYFYDEFGDEFSSQLTFLTNCSG